MAPWQSVSQLTLRSYTRAPETTDAPLTLAVATPCSGVSCQGPLDEPSDSLRAKARLVCHLKIC